VTLAPELPGGLDAIPQVRRGGAVAAVGHTEADAAQGSAAIAAGARLLTHAPNAMRGIESRDPSALVAFLGDRRARVSMIADGVHVEARVAQLLADAPAGRYDLAGRATSSDGGRVEAAGRLAGSALGLSAGPRTLVRAGLGPGPALAAAAVAPRRVLGLPAGLAVGDPADLVVLDADLRPRLTVVAGRAAYADPELPPGLAALAE
jgi:N-acetylglucosamine-6-phosphate deacetylase